MNHRTQKITVILSIILATGITATTMIMFLSSKTEEVKQINIVGLWRVELRPRVWRDQSGQTHKYPPDPRYIEQWGELVVRDRGDFVFLANDDSWCEGTLQSDGQTITTRIEWIKSGSAISRSRWGSVRGELVDHTVEFTRVSAPFSLLSPLDGSRSGVIELSRLDKPSIFSPRMTSMRSSVKVGMNLREFFKAIAELDALGVRRSERMQHYQVQIDFWRFGVELKKTGRDWRVIRVGAPKPAGNWSSDLEQVYVGFPVTLLPTEKGS